MGPTQLLYSPTHEGVYLKDLTATVGISPVAVDQLTDLIMIELPAAGTRLVTGKSFGEIESVKAVSDLDRRWRRGDGGQHRGRGERSASGR